MKEYRLKTLEEILEVVNEQNIGGFLVDFSNWLGIDIALRDEALKGKVELKNRGEFHWFDDGKTEIKATIEIIAPPQNK